MELGTSLAFLFSDLPWADRPAAARKAGLDAVEVPWPGSLDWPADQDAIASVMNDADVSAAVLYMDSGDLVAGDRGYPNDPDRRAEWRTALDDALQFATRLSCPKVSVLAGTWTSTAPHRRQRRCLFENLRWAATRARAAGVQLVVENLNDTDYPTYVLPRVIDVAELLDEVDDPTLGIQFDVYHCAMLGDDPVETIKETGPQIAYVQIADCPGRHEPGTGKIGFDDVFKALGSVGYRDVVGLEYVPTPSTTVAEVVTGLRAHAAW